MFLQIRPADKRDVRQLSAIHQASFRNAWPVEDFSNYINESDRYICLVADIQVDRSIGFILVSWVKGEAEILSLCVESAYRNKGIASRLLNEAIHILVDKKVHTIFLEVSQKNVPAIKIYQSVGFKATSTRKGYSQEADGTFSDAYLMQYQM